MTKQEAQALFAETYVRVGKGERLALEPWGLDALWIDNSGNLIGGDYFLSQVDIIDCLTWANVVPVSGFKGGSEPELCRLKYGNQESLS